MARSVTPYPEDHGLALARALRVVDIVAARPDVTNAEIVAQLVADGIGRVDAELLVVFVPCALYWPVLKQLGVATIESTYLVRTQSGRVVPLSLETEHYFTAALLWSEWVFTLEQTARPVSLEVYSAVVSRSPWMDAANQMLENHGLEDLRGVALGPLALGAVSAEEIIASRPKPGRACPWWRFWG